MIHYVELDMRESLVVAGLTYDRGLSNMTDASNLVHLPYVAKFKNGIYDWGYYFKIYNNYISEVAINLDKTVLVHNIVPQRMLLIQRAIDGKLDHNAKYYAINDTVITSKYFRNYLIAGQDEFYFIRNFCTDSNPYQGYWLLNYKFYLASNYRIPQFVHQINYTASIGYGISYGESLSKIYTQGERAGYQSIISYQNFGSYLDYQWSTQFHFGQATKSKGQVMKYASEANFLAFTHIRQTQTLSIVILRLNNITNEIVTIKMLEESFSSKEIVIDVLIINENTLLIAQLGDWFGSLNTPYFLIVHFDNGKIEHQSKLLQIIAIDVVGVFIDANTFIYAYQSTNITFNSGNQILPVKYGVIMSNQDQLRCQAYPASIDQGENSYTTADLDQKNYIHYNGRYEQPSTNNTSPSYNYGFLTYNQSNFLLECQSSIAFAYQQIILPLQSYKLFYYAIGYSQTWKPIQANATQNCDNSALVWSYTLTNWSGAALSNDSKVLIDHTSGLITLESFDQYRIDQLILVQQLSNGQSSYCEIIIQGIFNNPPYLLGTIQNIQFALGQSASVDLPAWVNDEEIEFAYRVGYLYLQWE
ncbi:hypothetical protein FGO68_gene7051 [Halteria grandinella]|uniref:Uncharacterized protein n=1 Tax=Halteria grandinella TaxID=5974 RepID=A0A8J8P3L8_HALGN|nr:hypothetical protein FGO68_gene7051 [Halteria grandinella]